jgi:hypothetical protein
MEKHFFWWHMGKRCSDKKGRAGPAATVGVEQSPNLQITENRLSLWGSGADDAFFSGMGAAISSMLVKKRRTKSCT